MVIEVKRYVAVFMVALLVLGLVPGFAYAGGRMIVLTVPTLEAGPDKKLGLIRLTDDISFGNIPDNASINMTLPVGTKINNCNISDTNASLESVQSTVYSDRNVIISWGKRLVDENASITIELTVDLTNAPTGDLKTAVRSDSIYNADLLVARVVLKKSASVTSTVYGTREIGLNWDPVEGETVGYQILRGIPSLPNMFNSIGTVTADVYNYRDCSVLPGTAYTYAVIPLEYESKGIRMDYIVTTATTPSESSGGGGGGGGGGSTSKTEPVTSTELEPQQLSNENGLIQTKLSIGSREIVVNGVSKPLDLAPEIRNGRTLVPLRALSEALGASVEWDESTKTITVTMKQQQGQ